MKRYLKLSVVILGILTLQSFVQQVPEQEFVHRSVLSNRLEIAMAQQAINRSGNAEIQAYARLLTEDHQQILSELEERARSNGLRLPDGLDQEHKSKVDALGQVDKDLFDQRFKDAVIASHEKSIALFESASADTRIMDDALKTWISSKLPSLRSHLAQARALTVHGNKETAPKIMPRAKDTVMPDTLKILPRKP